MSKSEEDRALATHSPAPPNAIPLPFNSLLLLATYLLYMYEAQTELLVLAPVCETSLCLLQHARCLWVHLWQYFALLLGLLHWGRLSHEGALALFENILEYYKFDWSAPSCFLRMAFSKIVCESVCEWSHVILHGTAVITFCCPILRFCILCSFTTLRYSEKNIKTNMSIL